MKILQVNKFLYHKGGAETYMFQLSKALMDSGHEVKYWGMQDRANIVSDFPDLETENTDYSNDNSLKSASKAFKTLYSVTNKKKIGKVLDLYKPDIVHIHNYNFQITPSILPEIKKRGIKVVQTVHDSRMVCPNYKLYNLKKETICTKCVTGSFINCVKDKCFDDSFSRSLFATIENSLYYHLDYYNKYIDRFIIPSNFLAGLVRNKINAKKIQVIPNFVDIHLPSVKDNISHEFLYYGRIIHEKGIFELVDIFSDLGLKLTIIGTGPDEMLLKKKIEDVKNIQFLGPKYNDELFEYIRRVKYVIQPAKAYENCPMTILESFALGIPVIGANHSGFKELIEHDVTGYLLDFTNKEAAKNQIIKIADAPTDRLKKNIAVFYKSNLSKEKHITQVLAIYRDLMNEV